LTCKKKWPTAFFTSIRQNSSISYPTYPHSKTKPNNNPPTVLLTYLPTYCSPILYRRGYQEKPWCQLSQYSSTTESQQTSILWCTGRLLDHSGWNQLCCRCVSSSLRVLKDVVVVFREAFHPSIRPVIHPWMASYREKNSGRNK
jgi:hypothetical protein